MSFFRHHLLLQQKQMTLRYRRGAREELAFETGGKKADREHSTLLKFGMLSYNLADDV